MNRLCLFGLLVIFLLVGAGYSSHVISSETRLNISGVFGGGDEGRNWTGANACEIVNFTIMNDGGSNDSIVSVNVTVPGDFTLNASTIGNSSGWTCSNLSAKIVNCSNSTTGGLGSGSTMYVWFNVTSPLASNEMNKVWNINTTDNASESKGTVLISWIDGKVTEAASVDALEAYVNSQPVVLNWTNHSGCDNVSGVLNYTVYNSTDGVNFTVHGTTNSTTFSYNVSGLVKNQNHSFIVEIKDNAENTLNSSLVWTVIDTGKPAVYLSTVNNTNVTDTYYPLLCFNATDNFDTNMSCEIFVDGQPNGSAYIQNGTGNLSIQVNTPLIGENIEWYVNCTDDAGNVGNSTIRLLNVVGADIKIMRINFSSPDATITYSSNLTVFATVKNVGNRNISKNVTVTFELDGSPIGSAEKILNQTLTAGQEVMVNLTRVGGLKYYSSTLNHTLKAFASTNSATELNSTNNYASNYSLYVGYNVTITGIDSTRTPGANQTINVMVSYPNGTGVTGIDVRNFTIDDIYSGQSTHRWGGMGLAMPFGVQNIYNDSFTDNLNGTYTFKIGTYNLTNIVGTAATRHGAHTVRVDVESNMTGRNFKGRCEDEYNLTAPTFNILYKFESTNVGNNVDQDESTSRDYKIYVSNGGYQANLTCVNISKTSHDTNVISSVSMGSCSPKENVSVGSEIYICDITVVTKAVDSDESGTIYVSAYGIYNGNRYTYSGDNLMISVQNVPATTTETTTTSDTTTTTTSDTDYPNCVADDDCFGDEYCNTHLVCKELDCADDEIIMDHACVKKKVEVAAQIAEYSLGITGGPDALEIEHGTFRNVTFNLKNTGEKNVTGLSFSLDFADDSVDAVGWYIVLSNYSDTLESGGVVPVKVEINTVNLSIGAQEVVALAVSFEANANLSFDLKVTPDDDEKIVINDTMVKMDSEYMEMYDLLQVLLHDYANNTNVTELNDTLFDVGEYLKSARAAIESADYLSAYESQKSAESLMLEIKSRLESGELMGEEKKSNWLRNGLIIVVLLIAGLFGWQYYSMNMQQTASGFQHGSGFRLKKKKRSLNEGVMKEVSMLSGMIKSNKSKSKPSPFSYAYGSYGSKGMVSCASKKEGVFDRLSSVFRKNKRDATQKTLYDISSVYSKKKKSKKLKVRCL